MKILIIKTFPKEIDLKTYNSQELGLALALSKKGHIVDVMCTANDGLYHEHDIQLEKYHIKLFCVKSIKLLKNGWLKDCDTIFKKYDILQSSEYNQMFSWYLAKEYPNKTIIYHGPYYSSYNKRYNIMASFFDVFFLKRYKNLKTTFITKSHLAEQYLRKKGIKDVYPIGVGISTIFLSHKHQDHLNIVDELVKFDGIKLLYVGMIEERRNSLFLLDVLFMLKQRGIKCILIIVGKYKNLKYERRFKKAICDLKLDDNIIHQNVVEQKNISQLYKVCDIFLLPTRYDIYGMVLLEAMYYGLVVIVTSCGGAEMMINDGDNGYIIDEFHVTKWADRIVNIMTNYRQKEALCVNAKKTIVETFTWDALADSFVSIYKIKNDNNI